MYDDGIIVEMTPDRNCADPLIGPNEDALTVQFIIVAGGIEDCIFFMGKEWILITLFPFAPLLEELNDLSDGP
jgi:hypothetical protein